MRFWPALSAEPTPDFVSAIRWYRPRQRIYQQYHDWGSCAYNVKRAGSREGPTGKGGHNEGRPYLKGRHRRYEPRLTGTPFTLYDSAGESWQPLAYSDRDPFEAISDEGKGLLGHARSGMSAVF